MPQVDRNWQFIAPNLKETKSTILVNTFKETITALENQLGNEINAWNWGKVHTLEHPHPLGNVTVLKKYFNIGPFPMKGAREVIDNRGYLYDNTGLYKITAGPSTRRIIDFSDIENSISILPKQYNWLSFEIGKYLGIWTFGLWQFICNGRSWFY